MWPFLLLLVLIWYTRFIFTHDGDLYSAKSAGIFLVVTICCFGWLATA